MIKLWKVELYRFSRNIIAWIGMVLILCMVLFLASDDTELLLGDNSIAGTITATMRIANLLIVFIVSVTTSIYIGGEFKQKTICYEMMSGFKAWKISLVKTLSCGMINAVILQIGIMLYIKIMEGNQPVYSWGRCILLFFIISHICTSVTLYIMLFRDGAIGGCLAFVRFTLLSVFCMFIAEILLPQSIYDAYMALSPMSQWSVVIHVEYAVPTRYIVGIVCSFLLEYIMLIATIQVVSKKTDF